jgi:hypothetical protein
MLRPYEAFLIKKGRGSDCFSFLNEPLSSGLGSEEKKQFLLYVAPVSLNVQRVANVVLNSEAKGSLATQHMTLLSRLGFDPFP